MLPIARTHKLCMASLLLLGAAHLHAEDPAFQFMVVSDTHISNAAELSNFRSFLFTIRDKKPDFLVILGDICGQSPEFLPQIHEVILNSGVTVHTVPGNHDDNYFKNPEWYQAAFGRSFYSFDHKGYHFIMNCSQSQHVEWLLKDLASVAPETHIVLCQHYPPPEKPEDRTKEPWATLLKLQNLRLIANGHLHHRVVSEVDGKRAITFDKCFFRSDDKQPGEYAIVDAYRDGKLDVRHFPLRELQLREPPDPVPTIKLLEPVTGAILKGVVIFKGIAADNEAVKWVEYNIDRGPWIAAVGTNEWNFTIDTRNLSNGHHLFQARSVDSIGQPAIEMGSAVCLVDNAVEPQGIVLQQGLGGYLGCQDATVRQQGDNKNANDTDGELSDLECWTFSWTQRSGDMEFSEFYIKFDLTPIPADLKIKTVKLVLFGSRQNSVDSESKKSGYLVGAVGEPWTTDVTFDARPKPKWHCPKDADPAPGLTGAWPYLGGEQMIWPPKPVTIDMSAFKDKIAEWRKDPASNHGWVFSPACGVNYNMSCKSSKCPIATLRPKLIIVAEDAPTGTGK